MNRTMAGTLISSPSNKKKQSHDVHIRHSKSDDYVARVNHETAQQQSPTHIPLSDVSLIVTPATPNVDLNHDPHSLTTKL